MNNPKIVSGRPYDPRNPDVIQARKLNSEYIVYYCGGNSGRWKFERVSDKEILAEGQLESMLALLNHYPNSRRATWAEDMDRYTPYCFTQHAIDSENSLFKTLDKVIKKDFTK